jgi:hypothetical protein
MKEYFRRLANFWFPGWVAFVWLLMGLPPLYFLQTVVHEGTHAVAAISRTGKKPSFAPFPHMHTGEKGPHFLNGATYYKDDKDYILVETRKDCGTNARELEKDLGGFPAAPQILDLILIAIFSFLFAVVGFSDPIARFPLIMLYLGFWIDFMYGTIRTLIAGCKEGVDWSEFYLQSELGFGVFVFITWLFWIIILSHLVWMYWSAWARKKVDPVGFWGYRWVAMIFGVLSLICVIVSLAISDDSILKNNAAFIVPLIVQIIALCWYWIYFGLTFKKS